MKIYTIGVDLGGTNIKAGLVDEAHHIVDSVSCKTNLPRPEHEVEAEIAALCSQLAQRAGLDMATQIESVGIGTPGSVNPHTGVVEFNANFGYRNWPLVSAMEKLLPCRVYIENDANAAAYGEYIAGAAQSTPLPLRWARASAAASSSTERYFPASTPRARRSGIRLSSRAGAPVCAGGAAAGKNMLPPVRWLRIHWPRWNSIRITSCGAMCTATLRA